jgi:hypothetical protein
MAKLRSRGQRVLLAAFIGLSIGFYGFLLYVGWLDVVLVVRDPAFDVAILALALVATAVLLLFGLVDLVMRRTEVMPEQQGRRIRAALAGTVTFLLYNASGVTATTGPVDAYLRAHLFDAFSVSAIVAYGLLLLPRPSPVKPPLRHRVRLHAYFITTTAFVVTLAGYGAGEPWSGLAGYAGWGAFIGWGSSALLMVSRYRTDPLRVFTLLWWAVWLLAIPIWFPLGLVAAALLAVRALLRRTPALRT